MPRHATLLPSVGAGELQRRRRRWRWLHSTRMGRITKAWVHLLEGWKIQKLTLVGMCPGKLKERRCVHQLGERTRGRGEGAWSAGFREDRSEGCQGHVRGNDRIVERKGKESSWSSPSGIWRVAGARSGQRIILRLLTPLLTAAKQPTYGSAEVGA